MAQAPQRSTTGCWTCRLRRKKCAEGGVPCYTCQSKGIFCHGYGPKPAWKDRGEKEKEQLRIVLEQCSRKRRSRRKSGADPTFVLTPQDGCAKSWEGLSLVEQFDGLTVPAGPSVGGRPLEQLETFGQPVDYEQALAWDFYDSQLNPCFRHDSFPFIADEFEKTLNTETAEKLRDTERGIVQASSQHVLDEDSGPTSDAVHMADSESISAATDDDYALVHADLMVFYMCNTFPLQFSSYKHSMKKGWLLGLLKSSPKFLAISLSMSSYHQCVTSRAFDKANAALISIESCENYHSQSFALDSPDANTSTTAENGMARALESIACAMQTATMENFTGRVQDEGNRYFDIACENFIRSGRRLLRSDPSQRSTIEVFGSQLLTAHVFAYSVAPLGRTITSDLQYYRDLLVNNEIDICLTLGYEKWTFLTLMDIIELERWKLAGDASTLSLRELVKRAEQIERTIQANLDNTEAGDMSQTWLCSDTESHVLEGRSPTTTATIFGTAALVYVNTIVSGARPRVLEVDSAICKAVEAWKLLPEKHDRRHMRWPFCVVASLATGSQRSVFESWWTSATAEEEAIWSLPHLTAIVKDCWYKFDNQAVDARKSWDWRESLRELGLHVFFG